MTKRKQLFSIMGIFAILGALALFTLPFNVESTTTTPALYGTNVPTADSTANNVSADVIGNKTDAPATASGSTSSLMAYIKGLFSSGPEFTGVQMFVDSDVTASGTGTSWATAYKTVLEAVDAVTVAHTTIYVKKGIYDAGAVLNMDVEGMRLIGASGSSDLWGTSGLKANAADHIVITVNANECEIIDLAFIQDNANIVIDVATTVTTYKTLIKGCFFGGSSTQTYGVRGGEAAAWDSVDVVVEDNTFYQCVTGVDLNGTRCTVRNNVFLLSAGDTAIEVPMSGGDRPELRIIDNIIRGANSTDKGVYFSATPTEALFTMVGNTVINCAVPVTLAKYTSWYDGNYWGTDDWRYHSNWGRDAAIARGADGEIFYYDLNMAVTGLDGRSWASAYGTLAAAITAADASITPNRDWARRNTIYCSADPMGETITDLPNRCDIVGVGTDTQPMPRWTVKATIAAATTGCRFYNWKFEQNTAAANISFVTGSNGIWFVDCEFHGGDTGTYGVTFAATAGNLKIHNCQFIADSSGNRFQTAAIGITGTGDVYDIDIRDSYIEGTIGIAIASTITGTGSIRMSNCDVYATNVTIDDDANALKVFNTRCVSQAIAGGATAPNAIDVNAGMVAGLYLMTADSNGPFPVLSAHD